MTVRGRSADEMAMAVLRLARNQPERERLGKNAEAAFNTYFTLSATTANYMKLYKTSRRVMRRKN
jgi:glycosyltransferase involved in cell wall biosynthesis